MLTSLQEKYPIHTIINILQKKKTSKRTEVLVNPQLLQNCQNCPAKYKQIHVNIELKYPQSWHGINRSSHESNPSKLHEKLC